MTSSERVGGSELTAEAAGCTGVRHGVVAIGTADGVRSGDDVRVPSCKRGGFDLVVGRRSRATRRGWGTSDCVGGTGAVGAPGFVTLEARVVPAAVVVGAVVKVPVDCAEVDAGSSPWCRSDFSGSGAIIMSPRGRERSYRDTPSWSYQ